MTTTDIAMAPCVRRLLCLLQRSPGAAAGAAGLLSEASPADISDLAMLQDRQMVVAAALGDFGTAATVDLPHATMADLRQKRVWLEITTRGSAWVEDDPVNGVVRAVARACRSGTTIRHLKSNLGLSRAAVDEAANLGWVTLHDEFGAEHQSTSHRGVPRDDILDWSVKVSRTGRWVVGL